MRSLPYIQGILLTSSLLWLQVLILSFTSFKLEQHADCSYDFLQIHDGPSASDHMIGRYCGSTLPNNGHINTTQNQVYLWFKSDASNNGDGFSLVYNAAEPSRDDSSNLAFQWSLIFHVVDVRTCIEYCFINLTRCALLHISIWYFTPNKLI